jgi:hypothetical protein
MPALLRLVRGGGVAPGLRPAVWPLLLGLVGPDDCATARAAKWGAARGEFERLMALAGDAAAAAAYYEQQVRAPHTALGAGARQLCGRRAPAAGSERRLAPAPQLVDACGSPCRPPPAAAAAPQGAHEPWAMTQRRVAIDAVRTASDGPLFSGPWRDAAVARLERLLLAYSLADPATGYCQGMADLAAPFVHLYAGDAEVGRPRVWAVGGWGGRRHRREAAWSLFPVAAQQLRRLHRRRASGPAAPPHHSPHSPTPPNPERPFPCTAA